MVVLRRSWFGVEPSALRVGNASDIGGTTLTDANPFLLLVIHLLRGNHFKWRSRDQYADSECAILVLRQKCHTMCAVWYHSTFSLQRIRTWKALPPFPKLMINLFGIYVLVFIKIGKFLIFVSPDQRWSWAGDNCLVVSNRVHPVWRRPLSFTNFFHSSAWGGWRCLQTLRRCFLTAQRALAGLLHHLHLTHRGDRALVLTAPPLHRGSAHSWKLQW